MIRASLCRPIGWLIWQLMTKTWHEARSGHSIEHDQNIWIISNLSLKGHYLTLAKGQGYTLTLQGHVAYRFPVEKTRSNGDHIWYPASMLKVRRISLMVFNSKTNNIPYPFCLQFLPLSECDQHELTRGFRRTNRVWQIILFWYQFSTCLATHVWCEIPFVTSEHLFTFLWMI